MLHGKSNLSRKALQWWYVHQLLTSLTREKQILINIFSGILNYFWVVIWHFKSTVWRIDELFQSRCHLTNHWRYSLKKITQIFRLISICLTKAHNSWILTKLCILLDLNFQNKFQDKLLYNNLFEVICLKPCNFVSGNKCRSLTKGNNSTLNFD